MLIKEKEVVSYGCPSAWYIYLTTGHILFVRYRWGRLAISRSRSATGNRWDAIAGNEIYNKKIGKITDGFLSWDDAKNIVNKIVVKEFGGLTIKKV